MGAENDDTKTGLYKRLFPYLIEMKLSSSKCTHLRCLEMKKHENTPWYTSTNSFMIGVFTLAGLAIPIVKWGVVPVGIIAGLFEKDSEEKKYLKKVDIIKDCEDDFERLYTEYESMIDANVPIDDLKIYNIWEDKYMAIHKRFASTVRQDLYCDDNEEVQFFMKSWYNSYLTLLKCKENGVKLAKVVEESAIQRMVSLNGGTPTFRSN